MTAISTTPVGFTTGISIILEPRAQVDAAVSADTVSESVEFSTFYADNIDSLARALTATLGDAQVAQEAAQEAMARACERWRKISGYDNPAGWCYRVGLNWATSRWRKRRREVLDFSDVRHVARPDVAMSLDDGLERALLRLPIEQRAVIVLRLVQDLSISEVAEALNIAEGTVQSRYSRGLTKLRRDLEQAYD